jgi:predicted metal-dependent phosphotriesterase family hydrolase
MAQVETVRGPVDVASLATTLMHEHVFVLNEEIRRNYPADFNEDARVTHAIGQLRKAAERGIDTIVDPTVIGLGRDITRIKHNEETAGNYTYIHDEVLPALAGRGVSAAQIETMLAGNPRRYFS